MKHPSNPCEKQPVDAQTVELLRPKRPAGNLLAVLLIAALCVCFEREIAGPVEGAVAPKLARLWQSLRVAVNAPLHRP